MTTKPTIENLESWHDANAGKRRTYAQRRALEYCSLLIEAMQEIRCLKSAIKEQAKLINDMTPE